MSRLAKRSVTLAGHATSIALEPEFWSVLEALAKARRIALTDLLADMDLARGERPLASACRLAALEFAGEKKPGPNAILDGMCPFFVVSHVEQAIQFYCDKLGFAAWSQEPEHDPFFAIVGRDGAMLLLKSGNAAPMPNHMRDPAMRWDAYVSTPEPDALAAEFAANEAPFSAPLQDTHDGLRGFEITDPDGYVVFFGRPR